MLSKIGTGEIIVIILVALFVIGPERLPKVAKTLGKTVANFKQYMKGMSEELQESTSDFREISTELKNTKKEIADAITDSPNSNEKPKETTGQLKDEVAETT